MDITNTEILSEVPKITSAEIGSWFPQVDVEKQNANTYFKVNGLYTKMIRESLEYDYFPYCSTDDDNLASTELAVKLDGNGYTCLKNTNQIVLKVFQAKIGAPEPVFITKDFIEHARKDGFNLSLKKGETGLPVISDANNYKELQKEKSAGIPSSRKPVKVSYYYNVSQLENPEVALEYANFRYKQNIEDWNNEKIKKYGEKAVISEIKELPLREIPQNDKSKNLICNVGNMDFKNDSVNYAAKIIAQNICAGLNGGKFAMYKEEAKLLNEGLQSFFTSQNKKMAAFNFGKEVGKYVREGLTLLSKSQQNKIENNKVKEEPEWSR